MTLLHLELIAAALSGLLLLAALCIRVLSNLKSIAFRSLTKTHSKRLLITSLCSREIRYRTVMEQAPIVLFAIDANGTFIFSEGRALKILPQEDKKRIGRSIFEIYKNYPAILTDVRRALAGESLKVQHDIGPHTFETQLTPVYNARKQFIGVIAVAIDVTERVRVERELRHQARYDAATNLPNQTLLHERIREKLQAEEQTDIALLILDLDHFREVNDTFGHRQGNVILRQVGKRLEDALDASATVARTSGNEFAIFLPETDEKKAREAVSIICQAFEQPFLIQEFPLHIETSIGIALARTHSIDFLTLLRQADTAMYVAKRKHIIYIFYQPELDPYTPQRLALLGGLRAAIANGEMVLYYQPQVDLQTGIVHNVEALIRWNHPDYGCIPPDQFIPLAEQTGLIQPLTLWVLEAAIKQCAEWLQEGLQLSVSINLSACNLREADLPTIIADFLDRYALPTRYICVEVTESAVMADIGQAVEVLNRISAMGIKVAVDDFGTGYSSLAYLKRLPVNELKIDRLFIKQMIVDRIDSTIVQSTITMARDLGLKVVAEGVEDQETANQLAAYGCDCAQGYFWSRPIPKQELELWLEKTKAVVVV